MEMEELLKTQRPKFSERIDKEWDLMPTETGQASRLRPEMYQSH